MIIEPSKIHIFWIKTAKVSRNPINNSRFQTSVCTTDINGDINDTCKYIYIDMQLKVSTQLINSSQSDWAISQGKAKNTTSLKPPPRHMYVYIYISYLYIGITTPRFNLQEI